MTQKVIEKDGKLYRLSPSQPAKKNIAEWILGSIGLVVSIFPLYYGLRVAQWLDSLAGSARYLNEILFGFVIALIAFGLLFFMRKNRLIISASIAVLGLILLASCGNYGIAGGLFYMITGIVGMMRGQA